MPQLKKIQAGDPIPTDAVVGAPIPPDAVVGNAGGAGGSFAPYPGQDMSVGAGEPPSLGHRIGDWWQSHFNRGDLPSPSPSDRATDLGKGVEFAVPLAFTAGWPMATLRSMLGGALGSAGGGYLG